MHGHGRTGASSSDVGQRGMDPRRVDLDDGHGEAVRVDDLDSVRFAGIRREVAQVERDDAVGPNMHREREDVPVVLGDRHRRNQSLGRFVERCRHRQVHSVDSVGDGVRCEVDTLGEVAADHRGLSATNARGRVDALRTSAADRSTRSSTRRSRRRPRHDQTPPQVQSYRPRSSAWRVSSSSASLATASWRSR